MELAGAKRDSSIPVTANGAPWTEVAKKTGSAEI
jgi:hypothetical protein